MARSSFTLFSALVLLAATALQASAYTYVGCANDVMTDGGGRITANTLGECASYCTAVSTPRNYFYFEAGSGECICTNTSPPAGSFVPALDSSGTCVGSQYSVNSIKTSFNFQGCASNMVTDENPGTFTNLESCFQACADKGSVMYNPIYTSQTQFGCRCNTPGTIDSTSSTTCSEDSWYTFTHSAAAAASGLAKRNLRARLEQLRLSQQTYCPNGHTACVVEGAPETYECINTKAELESCGGCLYGEYKPTANQTMGVDCAALPGVSMGAVTCQNSECHAYDCRAGFELVAGICVHTA